MTQNYFLVIALIEVVTFYSLIYLIIKANRWVKEKQRYIDDLALDLPEYIKDFRMKLQMFNQELKKKNIPEPLNSQEIGNIIGSIFSEALKSKIPIHPIKGKLVIFSILFKLWKYRDRLKATFMNQYSR